MIDLNNPFLFEVAWEVANKVGGIYTVIKTKAPCTVDEYLDRYMLIGPLSHRSAGLEVENVPIEKCPHPAITEALKRMRSQGINFVYGKWLIEGSPMVILLDIGSAAYRLDEWKSDLWLQSGIPSPPNDTEMNDAILFGYLVAWFLGEASAQIAGARPLIAHFHEWLSAVGLVLVRKRQIPNVCTIFTTHATLLGRYLCAGNEDFYNHLKFFDVDVEAGKRGIYHRYCLERSGAHCADVFTTVSHITAYEAEHLLKRKPDGVLPNGLNVVKFSAIHEFQNLHAKNKEKIHDFVRGHFYGHYDFNLDNTLYFFTAGRYEYRNKGVDMFLEALARLNYRLKYFNSSMTIVAFIIMPAPNHSYTVEALKGQAVTKQLHDSVLEIQSKIGQKIYESALRLKSIDKKDLLEEQDLVLLKRRIFALKRESLPPIVTHNMTDDSKDPVLNEIRRLQLFNAPSDRVKVIFHPEFLSSNNPVLGLDYEDFVRGCHLGVFPSYYEPWGYTPAECTVMGVPSITTNLSGFGCFMEENVENPADYGIYIIDRRTKSVEESVQQLTDDMLQFCQKSRRQRILQRNRTERLSEILDWNTMGLEYVKARELSLRRKYSSHYYGGSSTTSNNNEDEGNNGNNNNNGEASHSLTIATDDSNTNSNNNNKTVLKPISTPSSPKMKSTFLDDDADGATIMAEKLANELEDVLKVENAEDIKKEQSL